MPSSFLFVDTVTIQRKAATRDSSGSAVENYADVTGLTDLPARIDELAGSAIRFHGQRQVVLTHAIYLTQDYGILRGDRVQSGSRYFIVHGVVNMAGHHKVWRLEVKEET